VKQLTIWKIKLLIRKIILKIFNHKFACCMKITKNCDKCTPDDMAATLNEYERLMEENGMAFPCYKCPNIGSDAPRCDSYQTCNKWNKWAAQGGEKE
jgi:hypothetical protein